VKNSIQKSVKNLVSRYSKGSKKFLDFLNFFLWLPAVLIDFLSHRDHRSEKDIRKSGYQAAG
jgi:hypothetical protein